MLQELHVRDLGVLGRAAVSFAPGLNVVTGETGAGKTLLMTSLALLTGARGESRLVSSGAAEAMVEAVLSPPATAGPVLADLGVDAADGLVVARRVGADGRSRAWVGGRLVPVSTLGEVCGRAVEVHGQGAGFALARPAVQLAALDAFAATSALLDRYRQALERFRALEAEAERLRTADRDRAREQDFLAFQAEEIERAQLRAGEDEELVTAIARLEHAERLAAAGEGAAVLAGSEGAAGALAEAHERLEDAARLDASLAPLASRVGALAAEAAEAAWDLRSWTDGLEPDPARLAALQERAALIASLKRKYGDTVEDVVRAGEQARARLLELESSEERLAGLEADKAEARTELDARAEELSARRTAAAGELAALVSAELPALALGQATFEIRCAATAEDGERGRDRVEFLFASSAGRPPEPLGKGASGGELSRAMIAVTLALARVHDVEVLVFDEADQGVGGAAALELARRLARLSRTHQVLVVTHLPQIAAFADHHLAVRRTPDGVNVEPLDADGRIAEISRMLAGLGSSELAQAHAAELVELGRAEREAATSIRAG